MDTTLILRNYDYNTQVIRNQLKDINHAESVTPPIEGGHTINWLIGHVLSSRTYLLEKLGQERVWTDKQRSRYRNGSAPINGDDDGVMPLEELARMFELSQERLAAGLASASDELLNSPPEGATRTILENLMYLNFHEAYHIGQMTLIAQMLGKPTAYIS